jgi:hypothetical protein
MLAVPLNNLTKKEGDLAFQFTDQACKSFNSLKKVLVSFPMLNHYDPTLLCTLCTDALDFVLSGVLQQPDSKGHLHPIVYYSRKFTPTEINYDVQDKELLAIVDSFCNMRAWLLGMSQAVSVITDHKNLKYFMMTQVLNQQQA